MPLGITLVPSVIAANNMSGETNRIQPPYTGFMIGQRGGMVGTITAMNGNTITIL